MRQTISGETHKVEIFDRKQIQKYLDETRQSLTSNLFNDCLYQNKNIISDFSLNYLNLDNGENLGIQLKSIIRNAFDECEKIYPYMGDVFIERFFDISKKMNTKHLSLIKVMKVK